jgi:hypothetical protein
VCITPLLSCARQWKEMKENNMFGVDIANAFFIKKKKIGCKSKGINYAFFF